MKLKTFCGLAIVGLFCGGFGIYGVVNLAQDANIIAGIGGMILCGVSIATVTIAWTSRNSWS